MQIYNIFEEIDKQKNIKTDFLLSFADILEISNAKLLFKFLAKTNELNNLNKIIVFDKFSRKYDYEKNKEYDYIWLDDIKIELENDVTYEGGYGHLQKIN